MVCGAKEEKIVNLEKLHEFMELKERQKNLKAELEEVTKRCAEMNRDLLPMFQDACIQNMSLGGKTVYQHRQIWASPSDRDRLTQAFRDIGADEMITESVHGQRLSAWVRDIEVNEGRQLSPEELKTRLPAEVRDLINVAEVIELRIRR